MSPRCFDNFCAPRCSFIWKLGLDEKDPLVYSQNKGKERDWKERIRLLSGNGQTKTHNEGVDGGCQLEHEDNSVVTSLSVCCMHLLLKIFKFVHLIYRVTQVKSSNQRGHLSSLDMKWEELKEWPFWTAEFTIKSICNFCRVRQAEDSLWISCGWTWGHSFPSSVVKGTDTVQYIIKSIFSRLVASFIRHIE